MRGTGALVALALVLGLLAPGVQAAAGVTLERQTPIGDGHVQVQGSDPVAYSTTYTLQLDRAMAMRFLSRFDTPAAGGTVATDHVARWSVDGVAVGASSRTAGTPTVQLAAGNHDVAVAWELGPAASGTYRLAATAREVPAGSGAGTSSADRDEALLRVTRTEATSTSTTTTSTAPASSSTSTSSSPTTSTTSSATVTASSSSSTSSSASTTLSASSTSTSRTSSTPPPPPPPPPADTTPPPQVTGLQVTDARQDGLRLSWAAASDPSGVYYEVYVSTGLLESGAETLAATTGGTTLQHDGLSPGTTYAYRVRAVDGAGNVGPLSTQAQGRTLDGPDTTAPSAVTGLRVAKRTATTTALEWSAASDDRAVTGYRVTRDGALLATVTGPQFTDEGLRPADTPTYQVRASDAAGNLGPAAAVQAPAFQAPPAQPLRITRVSTETDGDDVTVSWTTDETSAGSITFDGVRVDVAAGVEFQVTFRDLDDGAHRFTIAMSTSDGRGATRQGAVTIAPGRDTSSQQASAGTVTGLEQALGVELAGDTLFLDDTDADGVADTLRDDAGGLTTVQSFGVQDLILVRDEATGRLAIVAADGALAAPVAPQPAIVRGVETQQDLRKLVIDVPEKAGWIVVAFDDPYPDEPILGVLASNGTLLPADVAWRSGGQIRFIDDPSVQYTIVFDHAVVTAAGADASPVDAEASSRVTWAIVGIGLLAVVAVLLVVRGRLVR